MTEKAHAQVASRWPAFHKLWWLVALVLFVLLCLLWLMGYGPGSTKCQRPGQDERVQAQTRIEVKDLKIDKTLVADTPTASSDTLAPLVRLIGPDTMRLTAGEGFNDQGATAIDVVDGRLSVVMDGNIDTSIAGEYTLGYSATDRAGNVGRASRTVIVEAPAPEDATPVTQAGELPDIARLYFEVGSSEFPADPQLTLADTISYMRTHPDSKAIVAGYHDPSGNLATNQTLSRNRALAVSRLLQEAGIPEPRIVLEKPLQTTGSGAPEEARRVEVRIGN